MHKCTDFTWKAGLRVQKNHLEHWKRLLKPEFYDTLAAKVLELTQEACGPEATGYDVPRGQDITNIVLNLK